MTRGRGERPECRLSAPDLRSLGIAEEDMLIARPRSGVLKPSYFLLVDRRMRSVVLLVRGTQSIKVRRQLSFVRKPWPMGSWRVFWWRDLFLRQRSAS